MAVAAAALVVVLVTTLIFVLRDPGPQSGPAATSPITRRPAAVLPSEPLSGSYTWASGVQLTLSVKAERFGVRYPYCEDGSCGFAEEDDIRVLLTYKVSVPKGLRDRVDPAACPGALATTASAPADAIRPITDSYARPIATITAGQTTSGVLEYSVDEELRDAQLQVSSTCGDVRRSARRFSSAVRCPNCASRRRPSEVGGEPVEPRLPPAARRPGA